MSYYPKIIFVTAIAAVFQFTAATAPHAFPFEEFIEDQEEEYLDRVWQKRNWKLCRKWERQCDRGSKSACYKYEDKCDEDD